MVERHSITGEGTSKAMREEMRQRMLDLGSESPQVLNRYGSTESSSMLECVDGGGWHNPSPDQTFLEVVDPESGARLGNGEKGLLLVTHLIRRGTVLLRYAVGDIVAMTDEVCPHCGRTAERIVSQPVRTRDIRLSMDELVLRVAAPADSRDRVVRDVAARTLSATQIRPRVEVVEANAIFDPAKDPKAQRIVDRRPAVQ